MELLELAELVQETAKELRGDGRVVRAGRELGLTEVELFFGDFGPELASDIVFKGNGDQGSSNCEGTLEKTADVFARFLRNLRHWESFARRHGLMEIIISIKQFVGVTMRDLYIQEDPSRVIPDDPMILF